MIKNVIGSASEANCAALFINSIEAILVITILEEMGHPQPATPMQVDNSTCDGIMNCKIQKTIQGNGHTFLLGDR